MKKRILSTVSFLFLGAAVFAQAGKADSYFKYGNFDYALDEYLELIEETPDDKELNYKIGVCYLNTNIDKGAAVPYFEKVLASKKYSPETPYLLARAYQYAYRFDDAIKYYNLYKDAGKGNPLNLETVEHQIAQCENAKKLMQAPVDVTFINLGKEINSVYDDYYPFVPTNEAFLVFNSRREKNSVQQDNGQYFTNTYISKVIDGKYKVARETFEINDSKTNDEVVGLSADGSKIVYYKENFRGYGDLHLASFSKEGKASNAKVLGETINSKFTEIAGAISEDGKKFYFASDREGGYGGTDIYVCQILPNGEWSEAMNLGPTINTEHNEDFPNIYNNGNTLYFSSKGHTSMGDYDIFKATFNPEKNTFTQVENLGYPINTPEDNMNFRLSDNGKYGYMAAVRKEGLGGLDIYRINFNTIEPKYTVIRGNIAYRGEEKPARVDITVFDENGEIYGDYKPNMETLKYVIILPAGNYTMEVESKGFKSIETDVYVKDKVSYKPEVLRDIVLEKQ